MKNIITTRGNEQQGEGGSRIGQWNGTVSILLTVLVMSSAFVLKMNISSKISAVEKEIAVLKADIEKKQSQIFNQEKRAEGLKNSKVALFAQKHRMVLPGPGQVYAISSGECVNQNVMIAQKRETRPLDFALIVQNYVQVRQ